MIKQLVIYISKLRFFLLLIVVHLIFSTSATAAQLFFRDQVISSDTTWSDEIIISGAVVVGRKATLTIKAGTVVKFKKIDRNNDDIGDSELRVLGRLIANGTPTEKIRFLSAEKAPARNDWSFVLLFASGQKNSLSYCEFSHAFSGLQVHFSTARVTDNIFIDNNEGLRFGRAHLRVANNIFTNNDIGIRFTRMEGPVVIQYNTITTNRIGVFLVPSGQNIQNFFDPDRSGTPWNTGHLTISNNNIYNNQWYNLSLGEKQNWNLDISANWWGNTRSELIQQSIFDQHKDPLLGQAIFKPFAQQIFENAGIRSSIPCKTDKEKNEQTQPGQP